MTGAPLLQSRDAAVLDKPRLRSACDSCRQSKVKCSGGSTCSRCLKQGVPCKYSLASRAGKPKGSRNKATLKKLEELQEKIQQKMHSSSRNASASVNANVNVNVNAAINEATAQFWQSFNSSNTSSSNSNTNTNGKPASSIPISSYVNANYDDSYYYQVNPSFGYEGFAPSSGYDVEWSAASQGDYYFQAPSMIQTPTLVSSRGSASAYSSPLPTGPTEESFLLDSARTDPESFIRATEQLPQSSPPRSVYACSPAQDIASSFKSSGSFTESSTPQEPPCDCFQNQAASLSQLYNLDRDNTDLAPWRFDSSIQAVNSALSSCQKFLQCPLCRKECTNLLLSISTLDLLFRVLRQLLSRDKNNNISPSSQEQHQDSEHMFLLEDDDSCSIRCGQYSVPHEEGALVRSFLIHRMLSRSKEALAALREIVETYHAANGDDVSQRRRQQQQQPWEDSHEVNYDLLDDDKTLPTKDVSTLLFFRTQQYYHSYNCNYNYYNCGGGGGIHDESSSSSSRTSFVEPTINNRLSPSDVVFLRQVIGRCETMLEGLMRTFTFRYASANTNTYAYGSGTATSGASL